MIVRTILIASALLATLPLANAAVYTDPVNWCTGQSGQQTITDSSNNIGYAYLGLTEVRKCGTPCSVYTATVNLQFRMELDKDANGLIDYEAVSPIYNKAHVCDNGTHAANWQITQCGYASGWPVAVNVFYSGFSSGGSPRFFYEFNAKTQGGYGMPTQAPHTIYREFTCAESSPLEDLVIPVELPEPVRGALP